VATFTKTLETHIVENLPFAFGGLGFSSSLPSPNTNPMFLHHSKSNFSP
jgi:hypothetical protein